MVNAKDLLIKARVQLQKDNPFFSYLTMRLKFIEDNEIATAGVNNRFEMFYNPKWIGNLQVSQVKTLLTHEVMHIILEHLDRAKENEAEQQLFNISADIIINNILMNNGFEFRGELTKGIIPRNNYISIHGLGIGDLDKKVTEEVYNILNEQTEEIKKKIISLMAGFDQHLQGEKMTQDQQTDYQKQIKELIADAQAYSQQQGKSPNSMGLYIDELLNPKLNWREVLQKYITRELITDYTYNEPNKRSSVIGIYMPKLKREDMQISVLVDVSGSIGKKELTKFLSEIAGITQAFNNLKVNILFWDTQLNSHYILNNNNLNEIMEFEIKGGGGTDFTNIYDYICEEIPNNRLLLMLTDGYATFPSEERIKTIVALTENGNDVTNIPYSEVFKLK